jgi:DNA-binding response OmpR family regulator
MMSRAKILVVDDEPDILDIVRMNLEGAGYEVYGAATGTEALRQIKLVRPHLVVLDVLLPEIDGWEVLRRIRRDPQSARTPVVMLTCMAEDTDVLRGLSDGAIEYVTKPFQPDYLVASVDALLDVFDPAMREERRAWLLACQQRKIAQAPPPTIVSVPIYTRSNVEAPLFTRDAPFGSAADDIVERKRVA